MKTNLNKPAWISLTEVSKKIVKPTPPFCFKGTFKKPSHFPVPNYSFEDSKYWQTLRIKNKIYGIKIFDLGSNRQPELEISIFHNERSISDFNLEKILEELSIRFDLFTDISPFINKFKSEKTLNSTIEKWKGMRIGSSYSLYEFSIITTVLQNTTIKRSTQMLNNLFNNFGTRISFDGKELFAFWDSSDIMSVSEVFLRELKLGYRAKTLKRQADEFHNSNVSELRKIPDTSSLRKEILRIYGVGPATAQYYLSEIFHRYDEYYYIPPWEQKLFSRILFNKDLVDHDVILEKIDMLWGKWKMLALHYLIEDLFWQYSEGEAQWLDQLIKM